MRSIVSACMMFSAWLLAAAVGLAEPMKVSALHPLMADLARQVGGERVQVFDLVGEGGNPHRYEPRPSDLRQMRESALILAAGKGLEGYLDRMKQTLGGVAIVEVGHDIPSMNVGKDEVYTCCPHHAHDGNLDPHWWQGVSNMSRAARIVAKALAEKDAEGASLYQANARAYGKRLDELKRWARAELSKVPKDQRKLVTSHNAFGYFAHEFGYKVIAVGGLNQEQSNSPQELARTISSVRESGVRAVFPEWGMSAKGVEAVAREAGVKLGGALIADGNGKGDSAGFEGMIRHNVAAITRALAE
jgi:zinc/manganese transport system substrate-binding protein